MHNIVLFYHCENQKTIEQEDDIRAILLLSKMSLFIQELLCLMFIGLFLKTYFV